MDAKEAAQLLGGVVHGDPNVLIERIRPLDGGGGGGLAVVYTPADLKNFAEAQVDVLVGPPGIFCPHAKAHIAVETLTVRSLNRLLRAYKVQRYQLDDQSNTCRIPDVYVGKYTDIGEGCHLMPGVRIMNGVRIGRHVGIHCNTVIKEGTLIGDGVIIDSNCSIGNYSFEYMAGADSRYERLESVGQVIIENDVEIGSNCTIDRGTFGNTVIGSGSRIDNLVQIGHDVQIGRDCLIVAQVGIAGHSVIEDDVILQGQVGIAGHLRVGARSVLQAQSGLSRSCPPDSVWFGSPAREAHQQLQALASLNRLARGRR